MIEKLEAYFEQQFEYMELLTDYASKKVCFDHAFGALDFVAQNAENEDFPKYVALWDEWRDKFETALYE